MEGLDLFLKKLKDEELESNLEGLSNEEQIQIPFLPEQEQPVEQPVEQSVEQPVEQPVESDMPNNLENFLNTENENLPIDELKTSLDPNFKIKEPPTKTPQEKLLEEFREYRKKSNDDIKKARQRQAEADLYKGMSNAFSKIGTGLASGYANVKIEPTQFKEQDFEKQARLDRKTKLENMLKEYEILSKGELTPYQQAQIDLGLKKLETEPKSKKYFNTADGIVAVDSKGDVELIKESELKKQREKRLRDQFEFGKEVKGRLSDKEVKDISELDDGSRILEEIDNLLENTEIEDYLGPYASKIQNMINYIPTAELDENFVKMQQLVGIQLADYIKSISGAQVSEQEAQRLFKNIPNVTDKPKAFKTKLDQFKKELKDAKNNYLENIGKQKKSAEKFIDSKPKEDPIIKKYAQDYNLDYNKAEKILRARGYDG